MAKRRIVHPKRAERLAHLTDTELKALALLGAQITAIRTTVARRTITQVAEAAGINASSLGELERGRANVTYGVLVRLAEVLAVPVAALIPSGSSGEEEGVTLEVAAPPVGDELS